MTSHASAEPNDMTIRPKDRVTVDGGITVYTVQAVSRAGHDVYVTEGDDAGIGTWVDLGSVTKVAGAVAR